jgi:hypothetical protein
VGGAAVGRAGDVGQTENVAVPAGAVLADGIQVRYQGADRVAALMAAAPKLERAVGREIVDIAVDVAAFERVGLIGDEVDRTQPFADGQPLWHPFSSFFFSARRNQAGAPQVNAANRSFRAGSDAEKLLRGTRKAGVPAAAYLDSGPEAGA